MKLSDQIALLRATLDEFGYEISDDESVGEAAAEVIRELEANGESLAEECKMFGDANGELKETLDGYARELDACRAELTLYRAEATQEPADEPEEEEAAPTPVVLPDDATHKNCRYMKTNKHGDLCHNEEAFRQKFTQRGYPVSGEACQLWERAE
jgi:chromosome segregation ATPase